MTIGDRVMEDMQTLQPSLGTPNNETLVQRSCLYQSEVELSGITAGIEAKNRHSHPFKSSNYRICKTFLVLTMDRIQTMHQGTISVQGVTVPIHKPLKYFIVVREWWRCCASWWSAWITFLINEVLEMDRSELAEVNPSFSQGSLILDGVKQVRVYGETVDGLSYCNEKCFLIYEDKP